MEIVSPTLRRSLRGSVLDYRTPAEYFQGDSALALCCPFRENGMDVVSGNHILFTNVGFSEGAAVFNGVNSFGRSQNTIDLTGTQKISLLATIINETAITATGIIFEFTANAYAANARGFGLFFEGTTANDPLSWGGTGNVGVNAEYFNNATFGWTTNKKRNICGTFDTTLATNETNLSDGGMIQTPSSRPVNANNTTAFANSYLNIGMRNNGISFPFKGSISDLVLLKRILSSEENADYNAWMNDTRRANFWSLYFEQEEQAYYGGWGVDHAYIRKRKEAEEAEKKAEKDAEQARLAAEQAEANRIAEEAAAEDRAKKVLGKIEAQAIEAQLLALRAAEIEAREAYEQFLEIYEQARQDALAAFREYEAQKALEAAQAAIAAEQLRLKKQRETEIADIMTIMLMEL